MENVKADYAQLLESSIHKTNELREVRSQLATEGGDREKLKTELSELKQNSAPTATSGHLHQEIENLKERNRLLLIKSREERQKLQEELAGLKYRDESQSRRLKEKQALTDALEDQLAELRSQLATGRGDLKRNSASAIRDLPEAADLLNQLKGRRKKSKVEQADIATLLEILHPDTD